MDRLLPDLATGQDWLLITRSSYTVQYLDPDRGAWYPLSPVAFPVASHVVAVSILTEPAKPNWHTAGWVAVLLTTSFDKVVVTTRRIVLAQPNLIVLPKRLSDQYTLQVQFPRWFENATLEVWQYTGRDSDVFDKLNEIQMFL